eukprot:TRINITY_DN5042_c0_g1_i5.p1 TRINITY_DN5042_c0_g1~~TRINITY_DN5042_c0_g1_i5.p1  ORF type:complete len:312 (+),score=64.48 TRINITY_DN5042_c0_g1_i5:251-1186(+)
MNAYDFSKGSALLPASQCERHGKRRNMIHIRGGGFERGRIYCEDCARSVDIAQAFLALPVFEQGSTAVAVEEVNGAIEKVEAKLDRLVAEVTREVHDLRSMVLGAVTHKLHSENAVLKITNEMRKRMEENQPCESLVTALLGHISVSPDGRIGILDDCETAVLSRIRLVAESIRKTSIVEQTSPTMPEKVSEYTRKMAAALAYFDFPAKLRMVERRDDFYTSTNLKNLLRAVTVSPAPLEDSMRIVVGREEECHREFCEVAGQLPHRERREEIPMSAVIERRLMKCRLCHQPLFEQLLHELRNLYQKFAKS